MKKTRKILSVVLALLMLFSMFATTSSAAIVSTKDKVVSNYYKHAAFKGNGIKAQWVDINNNGKITNDEIVYCLQRGVASTEEVSNFWEGETKIEKSNYWQSLAEDQQTAVTRTLLHGYPNTTTSYGLSDVSDEEKIYAVQILVWEFTSGARAADNFSHTIPDTSWDFEKAFDVVSNTNDADRFIAMTEETVDGEKKFTDAYDYYCELLDAVKAHTSTPKRSDHKYSVDPNGSGNVYTYTKPGTYTITNSMFSEFKFSSKEKDSVSVSQDGDKITLNVKKVCNPVLITGTKRASVRNSELKNPVMIETGDDKQIVMYGTLEDPVTFTLKIQAEANEGGIGVMKEDTNGNPVSDVVFGVYSDSNCKNLVTKITTNKSGWARYGNSYPNHWNGDGIADNTELYLKELEAPSHLVVNSDVRKITVAKGYWLLAGRECTTKVRYNMYNSGRGDKDPSFRFDSVVNDAGTNGFKYAVYKSESNALNKKDAVKTGTTSTVDGEKGKGGSWTLENGTYYLRVLDAPDNSTVVIPGTVIPFKVVDNAMTTIEMNFENDRAGFVNETRGAIGIKKTDAKGNPLENAKFGVYTSKADAEAGTNAVKTLTTDKNGIAVYGGYKLKDFELVPGAKYYIKETKAPDGYIKSNEINSVTVESSRIVFVEGTKSDVKAKIAYLDKGSYANSSVTVSAKAQDENGNGVKDIYFSFYTKNDNGTYKHIKSVKTGSDGIANLDATANTAYYVKLTANEDTKGFTYDKCYYKLVAYSGTVTRLYFRPDTALINNPSGAVSISKHKKPVGSSKTQAVEGFKFNIYSDAACENRITTLKTDSTGVLYYGCTDASSTDFTLEAGKTYYFKETVAQDDYINGIVIDNDTVYSATVVGGKITAAKNANGKSPVNDETYKGGLGVMKVSSENLPLQGVKFSIYESRENAANKTGAIATKTTDQNGVVIFGGYDYDGFAYEDGKTYYIREINTYEGYALDDTIYPGTIEANTLTFVGENQSTVRYSSEARVRNESYGHLIFNAHRVVKGKFKPHEGVKLAIYTSPDNALNNVKPEYLVTDSTGTAVYGECKLVSSTLKPGTYYAKVVGAESGDPYANEFTDNTAAFPFTIYPNTTTTIGINNSSYVKNYKDEYGAIGALKVDENGNTLPGLGFDIVIPGIIELRLSTTFGIYSDKECTKQVATMSTELLNPMATYGESYNEKTGVTTYNLKAGKTYYVKELYAMMGYSISEKVYPVTVKAGQTTFVGTDKTYITYETPPTTQNANCGGFIIKPYGETSDNTIASEIIVKKFARDANGDLVYDDANGNGEYDDGEEISYEIEDTYKIKAGEVAYCYGVGKNTLKEAVYQSKDEDDVFMITIKNKDSNGDTVSRDYAAYALPNTTTVIAVDNYTGVVNYEYGGIRILKTDIYGEPIAGCKFEVSTSPSFTTIIDTVTSDEYGIIELKYTGADGRYQPYNETKNGPIYYIREVSCPSGYVVNTDIFAAIIGTYDGEFTDKQTRNGEIEIVVPTANNSWAELTVENLSLGKLMLVKTCVWGAEGFEFTLQGMDENTEGITRTGVTVKDKENPTKGYILFEDLIPGEYMITEKTESGYFPIEPIYVYVEMELEDLEQTVVEVDNQPLWGVLTIEKVVSEGPVEGWKFRVQGTFVNGDTYDEVHVTNSYGKINISGLYSGTFTITELEDQDIVGYYPESVSVQRVKLDWSTTPSRNYKTVRFKNILNEFRIYKVDMYDYPMSGVKFGVYNTSEDAETDTNRIKTLVTDENGFAYFKGFDKSIYYIKEVETYPGYQMSAEIIEIDNSEGQYRNKPDGEYDWKCVNYYTPVHTGVENVSQPVAWLATPVAFAMGPIVCGVANSRKKKKKS